MGAQVLRSRFWNIASSIVLGVPALVCGGLAAGLVAKGPGQVLFGVGSVALFAGAVRVFTVGVYAKDDHLVVRELFHTRRLAWDSIEGARLIMYEPETFGAAPAIATPTPELLYRQ